MNAQQRRAFEFVGSLLTFYGEYRTQNEREAYVVTTLYFGATVAALTKEWPNHVLLLVGLALVSFVVGALVWWQLGNLWFAARMVAACVTVSSHWLAQPPGQSIRPTRLRGRQFDLPEDLALEFERQRVRAVRRVQFIVPSLIVLWGIAIVLWRSKWGLKLWGVLIALWSSRWGP